MQTRLVKDEDKLHWDQFVSAQAQATFQQSWAWGEVLKGDGLEMARFMALNNGFIVGVALVALYKPLAGFTYIYLPQGPVVDESLNVADGSRVSLLLVEAIIKHWAKFKPMFLRVDSWQTIQWPAPCLPVGRPWRKINPGATGSAIFAPSTIALLDLKDKDEAALTQALHSKTRYNLNRALKSNLEIKSGVGEKARQDFERLLKETARRAGFKTHASGHYRRLLAAFSQSATIVTVSHHGVALAAVLIVFFGPRATYVHGGSSRDHSALMAPYLAQWHAIQEARRRGCRYYDFGGATHDAQSAWAGLTRFKLRFGATLTDNVGVYELILRPSRKKLFTGLRKLRGLVRNSKI